MVRVTSSMDRASTAKTIAQMLARVRMLWIRTMVLIAGQAGTCNRIERRRLSRWSSAIEILGQRLERARQHERDLEDMRTRERMRG
ncbi:MAG TPA: hypothetical protein VFZ65_05275 [Planctomycetota bacterium]|nr:hypothetical protein [Planctomycetota bacterium]